MNLQRRIERNPATEPILDYLSRHAARLSAAPKTSDEVMALADVIYSRHLLGLPQEPTEAAALQSVVKTIRLAGTVGEEKPLLVHLTAYVLGACNLLHAAGLLDAGEVLRARKWNFELLFDPKTLLPRWPAHFSHHSWRVSHWVGGAPSILRSLWVQSPETCKSLGWPQTAEVLTACDRLVDERTGLLRCYRSDLVQFAFRQLYRLRHDPAAGDVGGIVHLHWVNYAEGRLPYKAAAELHKRALAVMARTPFIEATPYCLDFDIVQIVRTTLPGGKADAALKQRATRYAADIMAFYKNGLTESYGLHRLPGALATIHECALINGRSEASELGIPVVDIMKDAYWI